MGRVLAAWLTAVALAALAACGEGGQGPATPTPATPSPAATPAGTPTPQVSGTPIVPPMEGPDRIVLSTERTNYWELPEYQPPDPEDLPEPLEGAGPEFFPPAEAACPEGWQVLRRPTEGFEVCYPQTWRIDGHGYVSAAMDDRWYSVGLFLFEGEIQKAHVSIYVLGPYSQPFPYTRDCQQAYAVTFAGKPATLCPDYPGKFPEGKIMTYQARVEDLDYYINVVPYLEYDAKAEKYLDSWPEKVEAEALRVAHTFRFVELIKPSE